MCWELGTGTTDTWTAIAAIVAFVALIQPCLFKRGTVDIHETDNIEIGYSGFGATIGITGTLRSRHRDMFIQWAKLILVRKRDNSSRQFEWTAFRTPKIKVGTTAGQSTEVALETPYSFMVPTVQPYRYNIVFSDSALIQAARPMVQKLRQDWVARIQTQDLPALPMDLTLQQPLIKKLRRLFTEFSPSPSYQTTWQLLNELYYWEPGAYQLTLQVQTSRPNGSYIKTWPFTLTEGELANLQNNVFSILEEVCGLPLSAGVYGFAYAPYNS